VSFYDGGLYRQREKGGFYGPTRRAGSVPAEGGFSPLSLSPAAWYDPSDSTTLFTDAGTTAVTADGDVIGRINDKSGNTRHWNQTSGSLKPLWKTSGGLSWIELDGVDDILAAASVATLAPPLTIVAAMRYPAGANTVSSQLVSLDVSLTNYFAAAVRQDNAVARALTRGASATPSAVVLATATGAAASYPAATAAVHLAELTTTDVNVAINGTQVGTATHTWGANVGTSGTLESGGAGAAALNFAARYYGVLFFTRLLTAGEKTSLTTWLGTKAGLSL